MTNRYLRLLIPIVILVALAVWLVLPGTTEIPGIGKRIETRLGLDLVGGVQALLEADLPADVSIDAEDMQVARQIVENRVNGLGVNEAVVQVAGERRIVVELPGETDPDEALATLRQTGLLEFVDFSELSQQEVLAIQNSGQEIVTDYVPAGEQAADLSTENGATGVRVFHTVMTGVQLRDARAVTNEIGQYQVSFQLKPEGAQIFRDYTSSHIGQVLAIVLDKKVVSAPTIEGVIPGGEGVITGQFTLEEANQLAVQLRYGSLPIPLKVVETREVGATLGEDSLDKSLVAGAIGFTIVMLFMALFYRLPGLVANLVIVIYAVIAFALFRYIPVTLTLPGIAGFLLSTGSALDANILIFERLKEELRAGRTLGQAIDLSWTRAWPSIRDSNLATLITCAILFWFGSTFGATIVKGFSLTLALGVGVSLFTALVITRTLLALVLSFFQPENKARWFGI